MSKKIYWLVMMVMIVMAVYVYKLHFSEKGWPQGLRLEEIPLQIGQWQGVQTELKTDYSEESREGKTIGTQYIMFRYINQEGKTLGLYVGYFNYRKGSEHHNPDTCFPSQGWQISNRRIVTFDEPNKQAISMQVTKGLDTQQVLFWFQVEDNTMVNKLKHQLYLLKESILRDRAHGIVVRLIAPIEEDFSEADILELQKEFAREVVKILPEYLP